MGYRGDRTGDLGPAMCAEATSGDTTQDAGGLSFSVRRFLCRLGDDQILRGYDLPLAIAAEPSVSPDETTVEWCQGAPHPGLISLCHSRVAEKANFHIVEMVGDEFFELRACRRPS